MKLARLKQEPRILGEIGFLVCIPVSLLLLHGIIPAEAAAKYYFHPWDPTVVAAYTATLFHSSWRHVIANSAVFTVAALTTFLLFDRWGRRELMWYCAAVIVLTAPPIIGLFDVLMIREYLGAATPETNIKGFSGITSAFLGLLWTTIGFYIAHRTTPNIGYHVVFAAYLIAALTILMLNQPSLVSMGVVMLLVVIGLVLAGRVIVNACDDLSVSHIREIVVSDPDAPLMVWSIPVGLILVVGLFPANPAAGGSMTNVFGHMAGLAFGIVISAFVIWSVSRARSTGESTLYPS